MGLDLIVESCAKPGHEAEWRRFLEVSFEGDEASDSDVSRFHDISIPPYERLGAPRVGQDAAADAWIIEAQKATTPDEIAAVLKDFDGYHVLALVQSDGVPRYSHGGLYDGVDETSFRGSALSLCGDVLDKDLIDRAWDHKFPESAIDYGRALLAAAETAATAGSLPKAPPKRGLFARLGLTRPAPAPLPFHEQVAAVQAAGRWFIFWGERGHAIRAWF